MTEQQKSEESKPRLPKFNDALQLSLLDKDLLRAYAQAKIDSSMERLLITLETILFINLAYVNDDNMIDRLKELKARNRNIQKNKAIDEEFDEDLMRFESDLMKVITPIISPYREDEDQELDWDQLKSQSDL